eukprot:2342909-Pyramimonas_sp.AAC.1
MGSVRFASLRARACHERVAHRAAAKVKCYLHGTFVHAARWISGRRSVCWRTGLTPAARAVGL